MKGSRELILGRIREALRVPAPVPGGHGGGVHAEPHRPATDEFAQWLPDPGPDAVSWLSLFATNAAALKAEFEVVTEPIGARLKRMVDAEGWKRVGSHGGILASAAVAQIGIPVLSTDGGYDPFDLERCDAGITECDALVSQTGSVVLTSRSGGGRALSVLPPHHVVVARRSQLLPDLPAAFRLLEKLYGDRYPSMMTFITGPSRTGDIERILVLGAHGPKRLTILLTE